MACPIPQPTTEGVIRPLPIGVDCQFQVDQRNVKEMRRLTLRRHTTIKIHLYANLSDSITLDYQESEVPGVQGLLHVPPVSRCTTCNKLGHLKAQCSAKCRCAHVAVVGATQQTLLPHLRRPPLGSLPGLPPAAFEPYRKQNPVWDRYPILGSTETSTGRSRR